MFSYSSTPFSPAGSFPVLSLMIGAVVTRLVPVDGPSANITGFENLTQDQQRVLVASSVTFLAGIFQVDSSLWFLKSMAVNLHGLKPHLFPLHVCVSCSLPWVFCRWASLLCTCQTRWCPASPQQLLSTSWFPSSSLCSGWSCQASAGHSPSYM